MSALWGAARLALLHWRVGALNEMQYRANFWVQLVQSLLALGTALVAISLVYTHTDSLRGWQRGELLAVMGMHVLLGGLLRTMVVPNMTKLMDDVTQGTLDYALTRPADAQLLVSVREISLWNLVDVLTGLLVVGWAVREVSGSVGLPAAAGLVVAVGCGFVVLYSIWLAATSLAFRLVRVDELVQLLTGIYEAGRWPVTVYPGWLRSTLTFLLPLAFAVTVPAEVVTERVGLLALLGSAAAAVASAVVARLVWRTGIRSYTGASA